MVEYTLEDGKIMLTVDGYKRLIHKIGVMYDNQTGTLLKHGEADTVAKYYDTYIATVSAVSKDCAKDAVMVVLDGISPEKAVNFMNNAINCTNDMRKRIKALMQN